MQQPNVAKKSTVKPRVLQDGRRTEPRFLCRGLAEVRVLPLGGRRSGTLLDLSASGCCIETIDPFPAIENPYVEVILTVSGFKLRIAGVVRRLHDRQRVGIEFIDVTERKAQQIGDLVEDLIEIEKNRRMLQKQAAG